MKQNSIERKLQKKFGPPILCAFLIVVAGCVDTRPPTSGVSEKTAIGIAESAGEISEQRTMAVNRVKKAKQKLKTKSAEMSRAQDLYVEAQKKFNALLDQTLVSIDTDTRLNESQQFKTKAAEASKALGAFVHYVDEHADMGMGTVEATLVKEIVNGLLSGGADLWKAYQEKKQSASAQQFSQVKELRAELKKTIESLRLQDFDRIR